MFFPGIMPKRKASLPNPQTFTTISTYSIRKMRVQLFTPQQHNKNRFKTELNQSYRAKKSTASPEKPQVQFKSNLTSFYQKHLSNFDQQKQAIKQQKQRLEVPQGKGADKNSNKLYFIVKRRQNLLNLSKRSKRDTINSLRNNKTEVISKQSAEQNANKQQKQPKNKKQSNNTKRYQQLSLNEIIQTDCLMWRYSPIKHRINKQKEMYQGW